MVPFSFVASHTNVLGTHFIRTHFFGHKDPELKVQFLPIQEYLFCYLVQSQHLPSCFLIDRPHSWSIFHCLVESLNFREGCLEAKGTLSRTSISKYLDLQATETIE